MHPLHDMVIPRPIYPALLEHGSQAAVVLTSTAMGDLAGSPGAVSGLLCWVIVCLWKHQAARMNSYGPQAEVCYTLSLRL